MHRISRIFAPLFVLICFVIPTSAQTAGPEKVVQDFVKAWNTHDMKLLDRLFADSAIWVAVAESRVEGRKAIVKSFTDAHTTWAKVTTVQASDIKVQKLRPDVAVLLFHGKFLDHGKVVEKVDRAMMIVAVKDAGVWKIAAGQITKQHEGA